jgi:hypothetical protein
VSTSVPPPGFTEPTPAPAIEEEQPVPWENAPKRPRGRSKLLVGGLGVLVLAAAGFFFLGSKGTQLNNDPIAQAATLSSNVSGFRMRMSMEMSSSALNSPITATGRGVVDLRDHATSMSLAMNLGDEPGVVQALGSGTFRMRMITDGTDVYLKLPSALSATMPTLGKKWVKIDLSKLSGIPGLSSLESNPTTSDPSDVLQALRSVSDSVVAEGNQRVDGVQTTHYRAELSLDHLADAVPSADRAAAQQALSGIEQAAGADEIPVDVWVDGQHLVRRVQMSMDLGSAAAQTMTETVTVDLSHYGPQSPPALPPSGDVQDLSSLASSVSG